MPNYINFYIHWCVCIFISWLFKCYIHMHIMLKTGTLLCVCGKYRVNINLPCFIICSVLICDQWLSLVDNLTNATIDDIELRICTSELLVNEDVPLELIKLYVQ